MGRQCRAATAVEPGELVGEPLDRAAVVLAHGFDLPADEMRLPPSRCVGGVALERSVLGMDVELDPPAGRRDGEIDVDGMPGSRVHESELWLHRHAAPSERIGELDLGVRLLRGVVADGFQRATEQPRARTGRVPEPPLDRDEVRELHMAAVEQLVHDRQVIQRPQISGEIERKSGR